MQDLHEALLDDIRKLLGGNGVRAGDLRYARHDIFTSNVTIAVQWDFGGDYSDSVEPAGTKADIHFGRNKDGFNSHTRECLDETKLNNKLHEILLSSLRLNANNTVASASEAQRYYSFKPFSVYEGCNTCDERGQVACKSCGGAGDVACNACGGNGRATCYVCGGAGSMPATYIQHLPDGTSREIQGTQTCTRCGGAGYETCQKCSGSGRLRCAKCGGDGYAQCVACAGSGFFIRTRNISAHATPKVRISLRQEFYGDEFLAFLCEQNLNFIASKIPFNLSDEDDVAQTRTMEFSGKCHICELCFEINDKSYTVVGFGDPPYVFIKPPIFDDLFADEILYLQRAESDGKISLRKAYEFFSKYAREPVLDASMKGIAQASSASEAVQIVQNACQGYISAKSALGLSAMISRCLDKISPTYSQAVWLGAGALVCAFGALGTGMIMQEIFSAKPAVSVACVVAFIVVCVLAGGALLSALSLCATFFKHRQIPKEYRQKTQNKKMFVKFAKILAVCGLCGAIYGAFASKDSVGKIPFDEQNFISKIFDKISAPNAPIAQQDHIQTVVIIRDEPVSVQIKKPAQAGDKKEKIIYIQKAVGARPDGIFGPRTKEKVRKLIGKNTNDIDEIYDALKQRETNAR